MIVMPVNVPIEGHFATMASALTEVCQVWFGLPAVASPRSSTAGNGKVLAAVHPPDEAENMV